MSGYYTGGSMVIPGVIAIVALAMAAPMVLLALLLPGLVMVVACALISLRR